MRLLFATKALWHQWRANRLYRRALRLCNASETHAAEATLNIACARSYRDGDANRDCEKY
jgi:hypothetical protein